jgi:hypothetical protein
VLSITVSACARSKPAAEAGSRVQPTYDKASGRLTQLAYDSDGNGTHDAWAFMDGARLIRLEADENGDGRVDRWEHYAGTVGSSRQPPERIERSTRFDGRISRREFFERGVMVRVEEDTDGDGALDKWETYAGGALAILALDSTRRGTPDRRLIYKPDGSLDRIEVDPTGSGQFQPQKQ